MRCHHHPDWTSSRRNPSKDLADRMAFDVRCRKCGIGGVHYESTNPYQSMDITWYELEDFPTRMKAGKMPKEGRK